MAIYYLRHGETTWNQKMLIQGGIDIPLSEKGRLQAKKAKEEIDKIHLDLIISSPLKRALETASIINEGRNLPLLVDPRIKEEFYGKMEGEPRKGEVYLNQRKKLATRYPGGESYLDVAARIYPFLDDVKKKYHDLDVLLVAHGGISRIVESYFRDMDNEEFVNHISPNCKLVKYSWRDQ